MGELLERVYSKMKRNGKYKGGIDNIRYTYECLEPLFFPYYRELTLQIHEPDEFCWTIINMLYHFYGNTTDLLRTEKFNPDGRIEDFNLQGSRRISHNSRVPAVSMPLMHPKIASALPYTSGGAAIPTFGMPNIIWFENIRSNLKLIDSQLLNRSISGTVQLQFLIKKSPEK
jgi:hypothetical protein